MSVSILQLIGSRAERLAWIFCVVDRASVDSSLYTTDTEIAHNIESDLIKSLEENSKGHTNINNSPVIITERKFHFTAREELGCFPIHLDGI
jgi:hypothetical protein